MKKYHLLTVLLLIVISSIVFYACRKDESRIAEPKTQSVSLKEAQMIYGYAGKEIEARFSNKYHSIVPHWENAYSESLGATHNAMYVPLGLNDSTGHFLHMLVMKDEGRLRSLLIEIEPDSSWYEKHTVYDYRNITGKLLFYSINGRFHQGFVLKDGSMVKPYAPENELGNLSTLMRLNTVSATSSDPCVYGTFGCQELAEVIVIAHPKGQTNFVYITVPAAVYGSNPSGSVYNGYTWYPQGGASPLPDNAFLFYQNHGKICGTYNWKKIGSSLYAAFYSISFQLVNRNNVRLEPYFGNPCVQLGPSVKNATEANNAWNDTWNQAVDKILRDANTYPYVVGDFMIQQNMKKYITNYLALYYPGSTYNPDGCAGVNPSEVRYCN